MPVTETDVIIVGAAPTGLTLARELRLTGVRTLVLERLPEPRTVAKAGGLGGRMLDMLRYQGLLDLADRHDLRGVRRHGATGSTSAPLRPSLDRPTPC